MLTFFNTGRRKAGSIALLMALMLVVVWGRSYFYEDHCWIAFSKQRALAIHTAVDHIAISSEWQEENGRESATVAGSTMVEFRFDSSKYFNWIVYPAVDQPVDPWDVTHWYWSWGTFGCGEWDDGTLGFRLISIPYCVLVLPLSLLSGSLILWKPHRVSSLNTESPTYG